MLKKYALAVALVFGISVPAEAAMIRIVNHSNHEVTDLWVNGFHHSIYVAPRSAEMTDAYTTTCGYKDFTAKALDGTTWNGTFDVCSGEFNWHLH